MISIDVPFIFHDFLFTVRGNSVFAILIFFLDEASASIDCDERGHAKFRNQLKSGGPGKSHTAAANHVAVRDFHAGHVDKRC